MTPQQVKAIKKAIKEGYALKAQHNNPQWREALEGLEQLIIDHKNEQSNG